MSTPRPKTRRTRMSRRKPRVASPLFRAAHGGATIPAVPEPPLFALVETSADLPADETEGTATGLRYDHEAIEPTWSKDAWPVAPLFDANLGLLLSGERRLCIFDTTAGGYVPLPGLQIHLAITEQTIPAGGSGLVTVYAVIDDNEQATEQQVVAHDWQQVETATGARVFVFHHQQSRRWYLWPVEAIEYLEPIEIFELLDDVLETYEVTVCYGPFDLMDLSDDSAVGLQAWNSPGAAVTSDDAWAASDTLFDTTTTHYLLVLQVSGYSPAATFAPKVVYVTVERSDEGNSGLLVDEEVKLVVGGVVQSENGAVEAAWPGSDTPQVYRFTPSLTRAESLAIDFGVVVRAAYQGTSSVLPAINETDWSGTTLANDYESLLGPETTSTGPPNISVTGSGGGNPGAAVDVASSVTDGDTTWVYLFNTAEVWEPVTDGAIATVSWLLDVKSLGVGASGGPHLIRYRWAMRQAGVIYQTTAGARVVGAGWGTLRDDDLLSTAWSRASATGPATPDFFATGAAIEWGLAVGVEMLSLGGGDGQFSARLDNFEVNVRTGDPPARPRIDHVQIKICGIE